VAVVNKQTEIGLVFRRSLPRSEASARLTLLARLSTTLLRKSLGELLLLLLLLLHCSAEQAYG